MTSDKPGLPAEKEDGRDGKGEDEVAAAAEVVGDELGSAGGDGVGDEEGVEVAEEASEAEEAMGYFCLYRVLAGGVGLLLMLGWG